MRKRHQDFSEDEKTQIKAAQDAYITWSRTLSAETRMQHGCSSRAYSYEAAKVEGIISDADLNLLAAWYDELWNYTGD